MNSFESMKEDEHRQVLDTPEIVPNSVVSLSELNENMESNHFSEYRMTTNTFTTDDCYDCEDGFSAWETIEDNDQNSKKEANESSDDIFCIWEKKCNINARNNGEGFVVCGAPDLNDTINSDIDLRTMESEDEIEYVPRETFDDSIEIVDLLFDQYLIPRVFFWIH